MSLINLSNNSEPFLTDASGSVQSLITTSASKEQSSMLADLAHRIKDLVEVDQHLSLAHFRSAFSSEPPTMRVNGDLHVVETLACRVSHPILWLGET